MRFKNSKRITSWILCMMLIVAMAFTSVGCNAKKEEGNNQPSTEVQTTEETQAIEVEQETEETKDNVLGEGQMKFTFTVVDKDGNETNFEIHTDKENVGEALLELDLIAGDEGEYGLYVKTVNGITADYDVDQTYWAFYINGEYASTGVDKTKVEEGASYSFKVEK